MHVVALGNRFNTLMLNLDVMAQGGFVPIALVTVCDGAAVQALDLRRLPTIVALFLGEARDEELHAKHLFMFLHIFL